MTRLHTWLLASVIGTRGGVRRVFRQIVTGRPRTSLAYIFEAPGTANDTAEAIIKKRIVTGMPR